MGRAFLLLADIHNIHSFLQNLRAIGLVLKHLVTCNVYYVK
jgi:hypothetical protein